jgi:SAM-dependent methyltransferase
VAEVAVVAAVAEVPAAVVAAVLVSTLENSADEEHNDATKNEDDDRVTGLPLPLPPPNLTKSVLDLSDLIIYPSNTFDAITCCYGYGLAGDLLLQALKEAHRVLVPGGILVICTWEQSAMRLIGRDVLETVRSGGRDMISDENDNDAFFMPRVSHLDPIALSGPGEFEALLAAAGFDGRIVATTGTYPFDLGSNADERFCMGTILVRDELESLGALASSDSVSLEAGGWANLAEEAFWTNIRKYVDVGVMDNTMSLRDNTFKLTVSTKAS